MKKNNLFSAASKITLIALRKNEDLKQPLPHKILSNFKQPAPFNAIFNFKNPVPFKPFFFPMQNYFYSSKKNESEYTFLNNVENSKLDKELMLFKEKGNAKSSISLLLEIEKFLARESKKEEPQFHEACIALEKEVGKEILQLIISDLSMIPSWDSAGASENAWDLLTGLFTSIKSHEYRLLFCQIFEAPLKEILKDSLRNVPLPITTHNSDAADLFIEAFPEIVETCLLQNQQPSEYRQLMHHVDNLAPQAREKVLNHIVEFLLETPEQENILSELKFNKYTYTTKIIGEIEERLNALQEERSFSMKP